MNPIHNNSDILHNVKKWIYMLFLSHLGFKLFNARSTCSIKWFCSRCYLHIGANHPILFTSRAGSHYPYLIFYHVRSTSRMSTSAAPLQRYLTDSFADQCLTRSIRIEIHIAICIHHLEKNRSRQYNGDSGENRTYHWRSQRDRLLHRSGIASKWSKSNLARLQIIKYNIVQSANIYISCKLCILIIE